MRDIFERAFEVARAAVGMAPRDGLAHPFGLAESEPLHWRVSQDVWDRLADRARGYTAPSPLPAGEDRLLGYPIAVDDALPPDSMVLDRN